MEQPVSIAKILIYIAQKGLSFECRKNGGGYIQHVNNTFFTISPIIFPVLSCNDVNDATAVDCSHRRKRVGKKRHRGRSHSRRRHRH